MAKKGKPVAAAGPKLDYKKTALTGFGFMATMIAWAIYDPYITKILNYYLENSTVVARWSEKLQSVAFLKDFMAAQGTGGMAGKFTIVPLLIGVIMTFDNIFGVIFQPAFGKLSDRWHSRLGRRRPFILVGAPVAALFFALIPLMHTLPAIMLCVILFVFVMSLWRSPVVALMPDLTPPELRSSGNAVINLMGGVGSLVGMVAGGIVTAVYCFATGANPRLLAASPEMELKTFPFVFLIGAVGMVAGMLVVLFRVQEKDTRLLHGDLLERRNDAERRAAEKAAKKAEKAAQKAVRLSKAERRSLVMMLVGLFFLFCGNNAITTFFALFADEVLHRSASQASALLAVFAVISMASALPSGWLGKRFGRKKTILAGLSLFMAAFLVFLGAFFGLSGKTKLGYTEFKTLNLSLFALRKQESDWEKQAKKEIALERLVPVDVDQYNQKLARAEAAGQPLRDEAPEKDENGKTVKGKEGGSYASFHQYLLSLPETEFDFQSYVDLSRRYLGAAEGLGAAQALLGIQQAVQSTTSMLSRLIFPVLILAGAASMMITVNTLPLVLEIGGVQKVGTFTGYYYTASFSAQIASPIVYGFFRMFSGTYLSLFYYSPIAFALAMLAILFVRHGEAIPQAALEEAARDD